MINLRKKLEFKMTTMLGLIFDSVHNLKIAKRALHRVLMSLTSLSSDKIEDRKTKT